MKERLVPLVVLVSVISPVPSVRLATEKIRPPLPVMISPKSGKAGMPPPVMSPESTTVSWTLGEAVKVVLNAVW